MWQFIVSLIRILLHSAQKTLVVFSEISQVPRLEHIGDELAPALRFQDVY